MTIHSEHEDVITLKGQIKVPYRWTVGSTGSRFFTELRDKQKIWGTKCPKCQKVYIPPRKNCPQCFCAIGEWTEINSTGILTTFTIVRYSDPNLHPVKAPFAYGIIQLDGADTGLLHMVGGVDVNLIQSGMRVEAVFRTERVGSLLDIEYFRPID